METKFTKEKLKFDESKLALIISIDKGRDIGTIWKTGIEGEAEATAKLFCASPLLYEALQRLYDFTVGDKDAKYLDQILNECESALKAASE